jgi:carboxyl-terminal processing protease
MKIPGPRKIIPYALTAAAVFLFLWTRPSLSSSKFPPAKDFDILERAVEHIRDDYVDEADPRRTMEGAFQGLIGSLDPMSSYLNHDLMARASSPRVDQLTDVGLAAYKRPGAFPVVVGIAEGSPAEKAGIQIGDAVSAVDDRSTLVWSFNEFRFALKGTEAKPVKLRLIHENATSEKTVDRVAPYPAPLAWTAENGTSGVIRIYHLFSGTAAAFKSSVFPKVAGRKETLILDLRGCREGDIEEARILVNLFVKNPQAGTIEKKGGTKTAWACPAEPILPNIPLVVWVDPATMGPAEIVAAVLRDLKRASVVGTTTAGFTAEQKLFPLKTGDGLLLTVCEFVLASGEKIFEKGVTPDVKIEPDKRSRQDYFEKTKALLGGR